MLRNDGRRNINQIYYSLIMRIEGKFKSLYLLINIFLDIELMKIVIYLMHISKAQQHFY